MTQNYQVGTIETLDQLADVRKSWNDLPSTSRAGSPFLTWEWMYTWTECFLGADRELFIVMVYKEQELIAIAPWCIHHIRSGPLIFRQVEFLGAPEAGSDYLDVMIKKGKEKEVASLLYDFLFQEAPVRWDALGLREIPSESLFLAYLLDRIQQAGKYFRIHPGSYCPVIVLPPTVPEFLEGLTPNRRQQYMRHRRMLEKRGRVEHVTLTPGDHRFQRELRTFFSLYGSRWKRPDAPVLEFAENLAARCKGDPGLQLDILMVEGKGVAGLFHIRYDDAILMYLVAVDRDFYPQVSLGNILIGLCLEKAVQAQVARYDFLKGCEDYKFHWANEGKRSLTLTVYRKGWRACCLLLNQMLRDFSKAFLR